MLAGPDVAGVSDDPEGAEVLRECRGLWEALPPADTRRVHLACLPMDDIDENAHLVNASSGEPRSWSRRALSRGSG